MTIILMQYPTRRTFDPRPSQGRVLAVAIAAFLLSAAGASSFTLEDVLSAPYPTDLVAASAADRIAWVMNERGVRNLWTAAAPDFEPVALTRYRDDGQALGRLRLTSDGSLVVFVRGGDPNPAGEHPNPTSDPAGAEQAIWALPTAGGEPWKVAPGGGPVVAPAGHRIVYVRGHQIFEAELAPPGSDAAEPAAPVPLVTARGSLGNLTWSPDGRRLAFTSDRGDHRFVGIFDPDRRQITWMAPDVGRDGYPAWSPDGSQIAFVRYPGMKMGEVFDDVVGIPFSLWVGDPTSGEARPIWQAPGADGGFAQYFYPSALLWAGPNRLVFTSEHDGWFHLYGVPASGGEAVDLSPGEGEVDSGVLSADGEILTFCGNREAVHHRHLWRVPTAGGSPVALTHGPGIETDPVLLASGEYLAFRGADARRPQAVKVVATRDGEMRTVAPRRLPAAFPERELVVPRVVSFTAADGLEIHGVLFRPRDARAGDRRPAVVYLHGGPVRQILPGWHYMTYYAKAYAFNQYLASRGYLVLAVNYRSGIGYGRAFRQAPDQGPAGMSEYQDVLAAARYLGRRPETDPGRIGVWGGSRGGYLAALALGLDSDLFAAGVVLHGVHDWAYRATHFWYPGGGRGIQGAEELDLAHRSSPTGHLAFWSSPVLIVHGDDDPHVMFIQSTDLVQRLREHQVHVETLVFPDEGHNFWRHHNWLRTFRAAADFLERFLGGAGPGPSGPGPSGPGPSSPGPS